MTEQALKKLLECMTLEEKAGQLVQCNAGQFIANQLEITGPDGEMLPSEELNRVMGSVLTFEDAKQAKALQDKHLAADPHKIPLLLMLDVIHGLRTTYPIPLAMGCSFDDDLVYECADMARRESSVCGVHVTFNPMVDTARDPCLRRRGSRARLQHGGCFRADAAGNLSAGIQGLPGRGSAADYAFLQRAERRSVRGKQISDERYSPRGMGL